MDPAAAHEPTYYEVLGVGEAASADEIRSAFRRAARTQHPDAGGSELAMQQLNVAWHALRDPGRRAEYDAWLLDCRKHNRSLRPPVTPLWATEWTEVVEELADDLGDDQPIGPTYAPEGWWALLPPATLMGAIALLFGSFVFASMTMLVFSGGMFFLAFALFIMAPMWAMTRRR